VPSEVPRAAAAREQGPREALQPAAWPLMGLRAELPIEEADNAPTVGRRQRRPSAAPQAAAAVPALPLTRLTAEQSPERLPGTAARILVRHPEAWARVLAKALRGSG